MESSEKRAKMLGEGDISKTLRILVIPAIVAMLVNAVYNIVDTIFVGMLRNTSAIAAVSVAFPMFMIIGAIGQMFGVGAASYISRLLGENNKDTADKTASTTFFTSLIVGALFTIFGLVFLKPLLFMFGATETIMPYAKEYSKYLVMGSIFTVCNMSLNNIIRAEGNAKYSMFAISIGAIVNVVLDPICMFLFHMGVAGASIATVISQIISFVYLISYFIKNKSYVKVKLNKFSPSKIIYKEVAKVGLATFTMQVLASVAFALINVKAKPYGDAAVAAIGINFRIMSIGTFVIFGYTQGFQPVAGYNYGAKKFDRLKEAIKKSLQCTSTFCVVVTIIFMLFAGSITKVFSSDPEVIAIGTKTLRATSIFFPLFGFQQIYSALFQALGKGREALFLSFARQGLFLIPSVIILPKIFALNGVIFSQTVADFFTIIFTAVLAVKINNSIFADIRSEFRM